MTTTTRSSSNPSGPAPLKNNGPQQPSTLYSMIMTPINLTVFLLSLVVVDARYSLARSGNASGSAGDDATGVFPAWLLAWLPVWLSRWLRRLAWAFRPEPYRHIGGAVGSGGGDSGRRWHYHSKQRKLIKMEADEAFQLYGVVLAGLGAVALVAVVVLCYVARRAYQYAFGPLAAVAP